ncbi:MAG: EamA family transporter [Bacillota bacterium]|jgi:transporter family protein
MMGLTANQLGFTVFAVTAALFWGVAPVLARAGLAGTDPVSGLTIRTLGITAVLTVYALATGGLTRLAGVGWKPASLLLAEGILASLLGHLAYFYALKLGQAGQVVPIAASYPLFAVLAAALILGEPLTWTRAAGALLVVGGVWLLRS